MSKTLKDHSRTSWTVPNEKGSPGDTNLIIGCLQRIADATEKTAEDRIQTDKDLKHYKEGYHRRADTIKYLNNCIRSLKGANTKLRNKLKSK